MISIIGAGPVGNYLGYLLAKNGKKVSVYEEHNKIGLPVQCAGVVSSRIKELVPIRKQFLVNKIRKIRIYFPNRDFVDINLKDTNYIFDRMKFDRYLADKAKDAGAKFYLGYKFLGFKESLLSFNKGLKKSEILIGADGPMSAVAKSVGLNKNRKYVVCLQARVKKNFDKDVISGYLCEDFCGSVIPENDSVARIALIAKKNINYYFRNFLKKFKGKIIEYNSGLIPVYDPNLKTQKNNVYLVGDAAGQVKASTYGGIIMGMLSARELARSIIEKKDYEKLWRKKIGKELRKHLRVRRIFDRFNNRDYNYFLSLVKQDKVKKLLEKYDRDNLKKYAWKLILREPRFLKFLFI